MHASIGKRPNACCGTVIPCWPVAPNNRKPRSCELDNDAFRTDRSDPVALRLCLFAEKNLPPSIARCATHHRSSSAHLPNNYLGCTVCLSNAFALRSCFGGRLGHDIGVDDG